MRQLEVIGIKKIQHPLSPNAKDALLRHRLFSGVFSDESTLAAEAAAGGYAEISFASGDKIVYGAADRWMALVLGGRVEIYSTDAARQVLLRTIAKDDLVGAAQLFASANTPMSRMTAACRTDMLIIEESAVHRLLDRSPRFRDNCLTFLADRIAFLNRKITTYTAGSAERRLALYLDGMAGGSDTFICTTSISAMADTLDISRASLYRALETLEQDGFLIRSGKQFTLLNRDVMPGRYH